MAEITNFPSRKKSKGFLSSMTESARATTSASTPDGSESASEEPKATGAVSSTPTRSRRRASANPTPDKPSVKKAATHNTTVNLTVDQRAWLRWREVVTKQSMGDLIREAIDGQMNRTPLPAELAAIFSS